MRISEITGPGRDATIAAIEFGVNKFSMTGAGIYRGSTSPDYVAGGIFFRNPLDHDVDRKSRNTYNYTTMWVDSDPKWTAYPKRGRSVIATCNKDKAWLYGYHMHVIPLEDTKIGVCPESDWWLSFGKTALGFVNNSINSDLKKSRKSIPDNPAVMRTTLKTLPISDSIQARLESETWYDSWYDYVEEKMNPVTWDFELTTWKSYSLKEKPSKEVWFSGPCALIDPGLFRSLLNGDKKVGDCLS